MQPLPTQQNVLRGPCLLSSLDTKNLAEVITMKHINVNYKFNSCICSYRIFHCCNREVSWSHKSCGMRRCVIRQHFLTFCKIVGPSYFIDKCLVKILHIYNTGFLQFLSAWYNPNLIYQDSRIKICWIALNYDNIHRKYAVEKSYFIIKQIVTEL